MLDEPETTIIQMTWVRAQHILAMQDENWSINELLEGSTPDKINGCLEFIVEMGE